MNGLTLPQLEVVLCVSFPRTRGLTSFRLHVQLSADHMLLALGGWMGIPAA